MLQPKKIVIKLEYHNADEGGELVGGITYFWSPLSFSELYGMLERKNRTQYEINLCVLTRADLHWSFWFDAYKVALLI